MCEWLAVTKRKPAQCEVSRSTKEGKNKVANNAHQLAADHTDARADSDDRLTDYTFFAQECQT